MKAINSEQQPKFSPAQLLSQKTFLQDPHHPFKQFENRILIVDDQPANLKLLHQILSGKLYKLTFASSGHQALDRVKDVHPDLILLDLMMPDIDGLMICQSLKQNPDTADIPIIFLTASHETNHLLQAFELGAADYVTKPFRPAELLARVKAHLSLQKAQSDLHALNQQLEAKVQQRTAALYHAYSFSRVSQQIAQKVRSTLDETHICETVVRELAFTLKLNRCQIGIYDENHLFSTITYEYVHNLPSKLGDIHQFDAFGDIYAKLFQGQIIHTEIENNNQHAIPSSAIFLACSLQDCHKTIGDVWLYRTNLQAFTEDEIDLVQQIIDQTAIAIRQSRLYQSSQIQVDELERLSYAKDDFLKTISHELRTPLTTIKGTVDTLYKLFKQAEWPSLKSQQAVAKLFPLLIDGYKKEIKLIETLLEFVQIDSQSQFFTSDVINISDLVIMVTTGYQQRCQKYEQQFQVNVSPNLPLLMTDLKMFNRILAELLENASRYTSAGEIIELTIFCKDNQWHFQVSNSGVKLTKAELSQIFDKFYRLPKADRWQHGGIGLGLALVKKQVNYLGGMINAVNINGTLTIDVTLPV